MILCSTWIHIKKDIITIVIIEQLSKNSWKLAMKKHELMVEHGKHVPNVRETTIYSSTTKVETKLVIGRTNPLELEKKA